MNTLTVSVNFRLDCVPVVLNGPRPTKEDDWGNPRYSVGLNWEGADFGTFIRFSSEAECKDYMVTALLHLPTIFKDYRPEGIHEVADAIYRQMIPNPPKVRVFNV